MRGITVHGVFLAFALILAYQAWSPGERRSAAVSADGSATVWELPPDRLQSVTYRGPISTISIERRQEQGTSYLWGSSFPSSSRDSTAEAPAEGAAPASEFPLGQDGEEAWQRVAHLRGLRDLGVLDDSAKAQYELNDPERRLTVSSTDAERVLEIGGTVYASSHRYAYDPSSGRGYVLADLMIRALESGPTNLQLRQLHRFDSDDVVTVTVRGESGERTMTRRAGGGRSSDVWVSPDAPDEPDQTFENFMNHVRPLAFSGFASAASTDTMQFLVRIDYRDRAEEPLGFLELYRAADDQSDVWNYYLRTEATRILGMAHRSLAERVDRDLGDIF